MAAALSREYAVEILRELHVQGWMGASELARDLGMHVATAMRKLAELDALGLLEKRTRAASDMTEYRLARTRIELVLDLEAEASKAAEGAWARAERVFVREKSSRDVLLEVDEGRKVVRRIVFAGGLRRRAVVRTLELNGIEGAFLYNLPFGSEEGRSVAEVCRRAGISEPLQVARVLEFVQGLHEMDAVEVVR